ncbi:hypothetical protein NLR00_23580, partial [Escherichia coli]|nr:hypothetical protein [Escherichia coli]
MQIAHTLLLAGTFIVVFGAVLIALFVVRPPILQQRLGQIDRESPGLAPKQAPSDWLRKLGRLARPLARASLPKEGWEDSALKARFVHA